MREEDWRRCSTARQRILKNRHDEKLQTNDMISSFVLTMFLLEWTPEVLKDMTVSVMAFCLISIGQIGI